MAIVRLLSDSGISRVRRVVELPVHIHKTVTSSSTRRVETNCKFNPYFVTNGLLVVSEDLNSSGLKVRLKFSSKAICIIMGTESRSTWEISELRGEATVAIVVMASVTFKRTPTSTEGNPGKELGMPKACSTTRTIWTKFCSTMGVLGMHEGRMRKWTYIRLAQEFRKRPSSVR